MPTLNTAFPLTEVDDLGAITEYLHLDMPAPRIILFDKNSRVFEQFFTPIAHHAQGGLDVLR